MATQNERTSREASRRTTLRVAGGGVAAIAALIGTGGTHDAGAAQPEAEIEGAWRTVATAVGSPPAPQLNYFGPGGMLVSVPPTVSARTIGIGHWVQAGGREYHTTFWFHRFNESGMLVGSTRLQGRLLLDEGGDTYSGDFKGILYDASGTTIGTVPGGTVAGTRLDPVPFE